MLWCDSSGGEKCTTRGVAVTRCAYFDFLRDKTCGDVTELLGSDGGASSLRQSYGSYLFLVRAPVQHTRNTHYQQHNTSKTKMARRARPPAGNRGAHRVHSHPVCLVYFDFLPDEKGWEAVIVKTAFSSKLKPQGWGRQLKNQFDSFVLLLLLLAPSPSQGATGDLTGRGPPLGHLSAPSVSSLLRGWSERDTRDPEGTKNTENQGLRKWLQKRESICCKLQHNGSDIWNVALRKYPIYPSFKPFSPIRTSCEPRH